MNKLIWTPHCGKPTSIFQFPFSPIAVGWSDDLSVNTFIIRNDRLSRPIHIHIRMGNLWPAHVNRIMVNCVYNELYRCFVCGLFSFGNSASVELNSKQQIACNHAIHIGTWNEMGSWFVCAMLNLKRHIVCQYVGISPTVIDGIFFHLNCQHHQHGVCAGKRGGWCILCGYHMQIICHWFWAVRSIGRRVCEMPTWLYRNGGWRHDWRIIIPIHWIWIWIRIGWTMEHIVSLLWIERRSEKHVRIGELKLGLIEYEEARQNAINLCRLIDSNSLCTLMHWWLILSYITDIAKVYSVLMRRNGIVKKEAWKFSTNNKKKFFESTIVCLCIFVQLFDCLKRIRIFHRDHIELLNFD